MKDYFGREVQPGDKVLIQGTRGYKGLNERFVCKVTNNFGQEALKVAKSKEIYEQFIKEGKASSFGTENTRSSFIILESPEGRMDWIPAYKEL